MADDRPGIPRIPERATPPPANAPSVPAAHRCGACGVHVADPLAEDAHVCIWDDEHRQWVAATSAQAAGADSANKRKDLLASLIAAGAKTTKGA